MQHRLDCLASFAVLDRAWSAVYFAADEDEAAGPTVPPAGDPGDAGALMGLRGRLAPWVRLVSLDHCALDAWSRLRDDSLDRRTDVPRVSQQVLIWRNGAEVLYRELAPPEHGFIAGVSAGRTCGEAAGAALDIDPEFDLVNSFASLLHHRMLAFEQ